MKRIVHIVFALLLLRSFASAAIIGVETFDYPDGNIAGKTGGTFWDWNNKSPVGHDSTPSNWNNDVGTPQVSAGRLITQNTRARREHNGPLEGLGVGSSDEDSGAVNPGNNQKIWYARVTVTTGATLPAYVGVSAYDFGTERIFFGRRIGQANWGIESFNGFGAVNSSVPVATNTIYTLVAKVDYVAQKLRLYINPDLNAAEPATAAAEITNYTSNNWTTSVRLGDGSGGGPSTWDNLVVATTWEELGTIVNTTADTDGGASVLNAGGAVSLREAVKYSTSGTLITFDPALNGKTITLTQGELTSPVAGVIVTVDGSSLPSGVTIDGDGASRLFFVSGVSGQTFTLRSLTLTGGNGIGNQSSGIGGAFLNFGSLNLVDCTLANNTGDAGAIYSGGSLTLTHCTVTGNFARSVNSAGALVSATGTNTLTRCTISGNISTGPVGAGGIYVQSPASLILNNSIVAGNVDTTGQAADIRNLNGATITAVGANLIGSNATVASTFPPGPLVGTAAAPLNPKLAPLGNYGGLTQTMHPLVGSPAIDAGGTTDPGTTDQRGFPGFVDGDNSGTVQLDIGAVEAGPLRTATSIVDGQAGNLREVINNATAPGTHIVFAPGFSDFGFLLFNGELSVANRSLFIDASNQPAAVMISGQNNSRVFNIATAATVGMQNLKIVNGKPATGADGGGILNSGTVTMNQSTVASNSVSGSGTGGGIRNAGVLTINQSTLSNNSTSAGSGGAIYSTGALTVNQSTLAKNLAQGGEGSALHSSGSAILSQSTLSANTSTGSTFGTCISIAGPFTLRGSIVGGNSGGIGLFGGPGLNTVGNNLFGTDPLLAPLGDYGGPTQTMALKPGSPARDAGGSLSEIQQVNIGAIPGTFLLGFRGAVTSQLDSTFSALQVQNALEALSTIGTGNVFVSRSTDSNNNVLFTVTFQGALFGVHLPLLATGGQSTPSVITLQEGYTNFLISDQRGFPIVGAPDLGAYEAGTLTNFNNFIWETLPASATDAQHAAGFDYDGDGTDNLSEFIAGTNVTDPTSVFRVTDFTRSGNTMSITFPSVVGRTYYLESNPDLRDPNGWQTVFGSATYPGTGNLLTAGVTAPGFTKLFFRVRIAQ